MSETVTFRTSSKEDAPLLKEWLMTPDVLQWFPITTDREVNESIRFWLSFIEQGSAITAEIDGVPVGLANLYIHSFEKLKHQCLFVICIDPKHHGKGVGTALLSYLMDIGKNQFNIELLHLEVYQDNPAMGLYRKLGFEEYGRHPRFLKDANGQYRDKIFMQRRL